MAITVATTEPTELRAGDTWAWRREDLSDYPASTWTLTYYFRNATSKFSFAATADGDNFAVSVAKAVTAAYGAGDYDWEAIVSTVDDAYRIDFGRLTVDPNLTIDAVHDGRSFARRMLDYIEAALESRASSDQLDLINSQLDTRSITRDRAGLIALRSQFQIEVNREDQVRTGKNKMRIVARFTS